MNNPALIAIVDDDQPLREALVNLVRSLGFETLDFGSAESFLALRQRVDVLLSDIHMPGMDGLALQQVLRAAGATFPVIMMSADLDPVMMGLASAGGATACLQKPFESSLLLESIERALNGDVDK